MANTEPHTASRRQSVGRTDGDSARWTAGLLLLFTGFFITASVVCYYFTWQADYSLLTASEADDPYMDTTIANPCGRLGARLAELLVGRSFGVFGVLIPVMLMLTGMRIIRQRPLLLNHSVLSLCFVMILGSLTLGFLFGDRWSLCSSTGWGGAFGIEMASRFDVGTPPHQGVLPDAIGPLGTIILLAAGWILTGVFINRNFIDKVNEAGSVVADKSGSALHRLVGFLRARGGAKEGADPEIGGDEEFPMHEEREVRTDRSVRRRETPAEPAPAPAPQPEPAPAAGSSVFRPDEDPAPPHSVAERCEPEEESPFIELPLDGEEAGGDVRPDGGPALEEMPGGRPAWGMPAAGGFEEIDLSPEGEPLAGVPVRREPPVEAPVARPAVSDALEEVPVEELQPSGGDGVVVTVESRHDREMDECDIETDLYDPMKDLNNYQRPQVSLLEDYLSDSQVSDEEIYDNKSRIEETLKNFGIPIQRIKATVGPTVTLYEIVQAQGVKIAKIQGLQNDIAQSLKAESGIRIIAPIPGRGTIGIEVPNRDKQIVSMYSAVRSMRFQELKAELPVVIGRTIQNENFVFDLAKMPHLLVAGATGQGKSVGLNAIIISLLYRKHPSQLKLVMIDPKMVEFSLYSRLEHHFLAKMESEDEAIITDPKKAVYTLNSLCTEMDNRLELCKNAGAKNIKEYNGKFTARRLNPQKGHRYLPYIVVVIDEFADLIMMAKEVEMPVIRLAQKARAVGIHLIIATQRPSVDVITGKIKANFPARIAFRVMQMIDSRTIIDRPGANELIGRGDMLISKDGELTRIQCALVETAEVERVVDFISRQPGYSSAYALPDFVPDAGEGGGSGAGLGSEESGRVVRYDSLFAEVARDAVSSGQISTSYIQRNYEVGFNRAGRIMTQLESAGIVGRQQGAKPRDILFYDLPSLEAKLQSLGLS